MSKKIEWLGGHKIYTVFMGVSGCGARVIELELTGDPASVEMLARSEKHQKHDSNNR